MSKLTFKIDIDTRTKKADNSYTIAVYLTYDRKSTSISTGFSAYADEWNTAKAELKKSTHRDFLETKRINNYLLQRKGEIAEWSQRLLFDTSLQNLSAKEVFELIKGGRKTTGVDFIAALQERADGFKKEGRYNRLSSCKSTISVLKRFVHNKPLMVSDITVNFLERFEREYLQQKVFRHGEYVNKSFNGLASYLRIMRSTLNILIRQGKVSKEFKPFDEYRIKTNKTKKRNLTTAEIGKMIGLDLPLESGMWVARQYFMACYYMQGISLCDLARLKLSNISGDKIYYKRSKTNQEIIVSITTPLQTLLAPYIVGKKPTDYIFPIIRNPNATEYQIESGIHGAISKVNANLRKIAELAKLDYKYVSTYFPRHSYATNLKKSGAKVELISQSLGHENIKTTMIYLDSLDQGEIAKHNEALFAELSTNILQTISEVG